jgi:hypothetical protein
MRIFSVGPRHAAGFHVLIFYINVFIKRTRVCGETYFLYVAAANPRRTQPGGKKTIYGWKRPINPVRMCGGLLQILLIVFVERLSK